MGKVRIAQVLARAGLHLGATTVARFLWDTESLPTEAVEEIEVETESRRVVTAKYPGHVYHVDLTAVPIGTGFRVPWLPHAPFQRWPFCWWVGVIVDHFSRAVVGFALFTDRPSSLDVRRFLDRAIRKTGEPPNYIVTDKDSAFCCASFKSWCRRRWITPRFGKVAQHGSVAVVERFVRSTKVEYAHRILVPLRLAAMRRELSLYMTWYNQHRPNRALDGRTPREVRDGLEPANTNPRCEPRERWPRHCRCAEPQARVADGRGAKVVLVVGFLEGRKELPIVALRRAA